MCILWCGYECNHPGSKVYFRIARGALRPANTTLISGNRVFFFLHHFPHLSKFGTGSRRSDPPRLGWCEVGVKGAIAARYKKRI